jgi:hypothetical protein
MSKKRPKYRGCFCWCCGQIRPNERFSGRGHARHLCRDCAKLDPADLEYRQHIRNIERTLDWDGRIRRRQRKVFERFLNHPNPRVRAFAIEAKKRDEQLRAEFRAMMEADAMVTDQFVSSYEPQSTEAWDDMDLPFYAHRAQSLSRILCSLQQRQKRTRGVGQRPPGGMNQANLALGHQSLDLNFPKRALGRFRLPRTCVARRPRLRSLRGPDGAFSNTRGSQLHPALVEVPSVEPVSALATILRGRRF